MQKSPDSAVLRLCDVSISNSLVKVNAKGDFPGLLVPGGFQVLGPHTSVIPPRKLISPPKTEKSP